jgi:hypothetical protein
LKSILGCDRGGEFDVYGPTMLPSLKFRSREVWLGVSPIFTRLNWAWSGSSLITLVRSLALGSLACLGATGARGCRRRGEMRLPALCLTGVLVAAATPLSAGGVPVAVDHETGTSAWQAASATYTCPPGYYWEPDAYAPHGKFRPAHCAPRW